MLGSATRFVILLSSSASALLPFILMPVVSQKSSLIRCGMFYVAYEITFAFPSRRMPAWRYHDDGVRVASTRVNERITDDDLILQAEPAISTHRQRAMP